jgi:Matrixin
VSARALKALLVGLAVWCACPRVRADESGFFQVQVRLRVDHFVRSTSILAILKEETESIWRPYGVHVEWVDAVLSEVEAEGFSVEAVIDRRGDLAPADSDRAVLGRAFVSKDTVGVGPIRVSFDATERMLLRRSASGPFVGERDMGRALGRVLAHEIGHVLLAVRQHDRSGLMRAVYTPAELGSPARESFRLTCDDLGRLRSRIQVMTSGPETRSGENPERRPCPLTALR